MLYRVLIFSAMLIVTSSLEGDDQLEQTWRAKSLQEIEAVVRLKADAKRGALVLHKSAAFAHGKTYEPDAPASAFRVQPIPTLWACMARHDCTSYLSRWSP